MECMLIALLISLIFKTQFRTLYGMYEIMQSLYGHIVVPIVPVYPRISREVEEDSTCNYKRARWVISPEFDISRELRIRKIRRTWGHSCLSKNVDFDNLRLRGKIFISGGKYTQYSIL